MTIPLNEGDSYYSGKSCNRNEIPVIVGNSLDGFSVKEGNL